jgi:hypothetical protein
MTKIFIESMHLKKTLKKKDKEIRDLKKEKSQNHVPSYFSSPNQMQLVDVTHTHLHEIQQLVNKTCRTHLLGHGQDQKYKQSKYTKLVVRKVLRIENPPLYGRYAAQKNYMKKMGGQSAALPQPLETANNWTATQELDPMVNEVYLFHGTNPKYLPPIATHGFDERLSGKGLYGCGIYFAENSSKSDQYSLPMIDSGQHQETRFQMILVRVCLGTTMQVLSQLDLRRPPERPNTNGLCYDSLSGQLDPTKYIERVVFDGSQCYPEYVIEYVRTN